MKENHSLGCPVLKWNKCAARLPVLILTCFQTTGRSGLGAALYLAGIKWNQTAVAVIGIFFASLCLNSVCPCGPRGMLASQILLYFCSLLIFLPFCVWVCMYLHYGGGDKGGCIYMAWSIRSPWVFLHWKLISSYFAWSWLLGFWQQFLDNAFSGGCMELECADVYVEEIRYLSWFRVLADIQCQFVKIS